MQFDKEQMRNLATEWEILESRIKHVEQINAKVDIAAINELRYVGRRIVVALNCWDNNDNAGAKLNIDFAYQYFYNSQHDLTDAVIGYYNIQMRRMKWKYPFSKLKDDSLYCELSNKIKECNTAIRSARRQKTIIDRVETYIRMESEHFEYFVDKLDEFEEMEYRIAKDIWSERIVMWGSLLVGVAGLIFGILK